MPAGVRASTRLVAPAYDLPKRARAELMHWSFAAPASVAHFSFATAYSASSFSSVVSRRTAAIFFSAASRALADLSPRISQRELERLLGLSQGYLSRIYHGHQEPSAQLVVLLALLAQDPGLLDWTARYWAEPSSR